MHTHHPRVVRHLVALLLILTVLPPAWAEDLIILVEPELKKVAPFAPPTTPGHKAGDKPADTGEKPAVTSKPGQLEAHFNDDSTLKVTVLDETLELVTPYGKLVIPVAHLHHIELAMRLTDDEVKRITESIGGLADEDYATREAAAATLAELGEKAYPELVKVSQGDQAEAGRRAKQLIDQLKETISPQRLASIGHDVIHTSQSRIAGRLTATLITVSTAQFGRLEVKLADLRELISPHAQEAEPANVLSDPGNLTAFQNQPGKTFHFRVTGAAQQAGSLYGTGTYTIDGNLASAAVHAGALKPGQTKVITVRMAGQVPQFIGSTQNGFTSSSYSAYQGYQIIVPKRK